MQKLNKFSIYIILLVFFGVFQIFESALIFDRDIFLKGEVWRLVTSHFVHSSWIHFLINSVLLFSIVPPKFFKEHLSFLSFSSVFTGLGILFTLDSHITYQGFSGLSFAIIFLYFLKKPFNKINLVALIFLVIAPIISLANFPYQQFDYTPVPQAHIFGVLSAMIWRFFSIIKLTFKRLVLALGFSAVFLFPSVSKADLTDIPTDWNNFTFQDYKWAGRTVYDHESSHDPSHGISHGVQPASIDIASCSPDGSLPGNMASAQIAFYDDGSGNEWIALRMRLNDTPQEKSANAAGYTSRHWNFLIDIDGDGYKEYVIDVDGTHASNSNDVVNLYYNNDNSHEVDTTIDKINVFTASLNDSSSHTRIVTDTSVVCTGKNEYWLDVQIPLSAFTQGAVTSSSDFRLFMSTSTSNVDPLQKDWMESTCEGLPANDSFDYQTDSIKYGNTYTLNTNIISSENGNLTIRTFNDLDGDLLLNEGDSLLSNFTATYTIKNSDETIVPTFDETSFLDENSLNPSYNYYDISLPVGTYYIYASTTETNRSFTKSSPIAVEVTGCGDVNVDVPTGAFGTGQPNFHFIGFHDLDGNGIYDKNTENVYPFDTVTYPMEVKKGNASECFLGANSGVPDPAACVFSNNGANKKVFTLNGDWTGAGFTPTTPTTISKEMTAKTQGGYFYFGFAKASNITGIVTGIVYNDTNGDGIRNLKEPGILGAQIELVFPDTTTQIVSTNSNGYYEFTGISSSGVYYIEESDPLNYTSTTANSLPLNIQIGTNATVNFGDIASGKLTGFSFSDLNGNRLYQTSELPIGGVLISVFDSNGNLVKSTRTGNDGKFSFDLATGGYRVIQSIPSGYKATTETELQVYIGTGGSATVVFGNIPLSSIVDVAFEDTNANGIFDSKEKALSGIDLQFTDPTNGVSNFTTGTDGTFVHFQLLPLETYQSDTEILADYSNTTDTQIQRTLQADEAYFNYFGYIVDGTIAGEVFFDANQNGVRESNESGISNVTIKLYGSDGISLITSTTTNFSGNYSFTGNPAGQYYVAEIDPSDHLSTTLNNVGVNLTTEAPNGNAQFGDVPTGTISGQVRLDVNNDTAFDTDDTPFAGVNIELDDGSATTTDTSGSFIFINKPYGIYDITMTTPTGYYAVNSENQFNDITIDDGNNGSANFLINAPGEIRGFLYYDSNNNGSFDIDENVIDSVTVSIDSGAVTTSTDINGEFLFSGLEPGDYTVTVPTESNCSIFASHNSVSSESNSQTVAMTARAKLSIDFRYVCITTGTISGQVKLDADADQVFDSSDTDKSGVTITLSDSSSTTTDASGNYSFANKNFGNYTVTMTVPVGHIAIGSDSAAVTLDISNTAASANFLLEQPGTISGLLYFDKNDDGSFDSGDELLDGETVTHDSSGSTSTDSNGNFSFSNLYPQNYTLTAPNISNCSVYAEYNSGSTNSNSQLVTLNQGASLNVTFRYTCKGTISGQVKLDADADQVFDSSDTDKSGVTITLSDSSSTTTDASGNYSFANKNFGNYTVTVTVPVGHIAIGSDSAAVTLDISNTTASANFLLEQPGTISGLLYFDKNDDGSFDSGDELLDGETVTHDSSGSTTTDANGNFRFANLSPKIYTISAPARSKCTVYAKYNGSETLSSAQSIELSPGGSLSVEFRYECETNPFAKVSTELKISGSGSTGPIEFIVLIFLGLISGSYRRRED